MLATRSVFKSCRRWSLAFDPGLHSTQDTLVVVGYAADVHKVGYGPPIALKQVPLTLHDPQESVLEQLRKGKRLERRAALAQLIGLDLSLSNGFGISLSLFAPDETHELIRPLRPGETRRPCPDRSGYEVVDEETGSVLGLELPRLPPPICTMWADQGSIGCAGANFLINNLGYWLHMLPDPNHRVVVLRVLLDG